MKIMLDENELGKAVSDYVKARFGLETLSVQIVRVPQSPGVGGRAEVEVGNRLPLDEEDGS